MVTLAASLALSVTLLAPGTAQAASMDHSTGFIAGVLDNYQGAQTCAMCHNAAAAEIMATKHWTWSHTDTASGQVLGKKNVINNYCIAVASNEPRCTSCHVGIGWRDNSFNFNDATKVDCLVCHETTGTYSKIPTGAGTPANTNLVEIAKSVGIRLPDRHNCGICHFYGGGGDAVKHGTLDSTMENPVRAVDVHMGTDGLNFTCIDCHVDGDVANPQHKVLGSRYPQEHPDNQLCQKCHSEAPHESGLQNVHAMRVACQTCHVPALARGGRATKMWWDWSTAGVKNDQGGILVINDENGDPIYDTRKGSFVWESDVIPDYAWFNGQVTYVTLDTAVSSNEVVKINALHGDLNDSNARIFPIKRFRGKQPYDAGTSTLAIPHLFPTSPTDANAYWKFFDWDLALGAGQSYVGRTYSGELGFVETEMSWIANHMVAPKEQALTCTDCHVPNSRLDFAGLGYDEQRAAMLQNMFGFEVAGASVVRPPGGTARVELRWKGTPGRIYQVQYATNLEDPQWTNAANGQISVPGNQVVDLTWSEDLDSGMSGLRVYRIVRNF